MLLNYRYIGVISVFFMLYKFFYIIQVIIIVVVWISFLTKGFFLIYLVETFLKTFWALLLPTMILKSLNLV